MTTRTTTTTLAYGLPVPDGTVAAFGARLIVTQDGMVDLVRDRTDRFGDPEQLHRIFDELPEVVAEIRRLLVDYRMRTREAELFEFDCGDVHVRANTNGSAGYCYLTAYL